MFVFLELLINFFKYCFFIKSIISRVINKFNKLVDDVDKLYDKTYDKISDDVYAIKNNIEISNSKLCCK